MDNPMQVKLPKRVKLGYGIGQMGDSIGFNVFYFFFLFFLTDIIGIHPSIAGSISLIAVVWDAVTDPVIGHMSDNLRSRYGRRRPFMIGAAVPYAICMFLLFNNVNLDTNAKNMYYIIVSMLFWTTYTAYVIPYFALGAEVTQDFEERTSVRVWASYFMYAAVMIASSAPPMIVAMTEKAGGTAMGGWRNVGIIFAIITLAVIVVCWATTKGGEVIKGAEAQMAAKKDVKKENILKAYIDIFKLKPVRPLAVSVLLWSLVSSMQSGGAVYLMTNNLNYSPERQSVFFICLSVFAMLWLPPINKLANKFDKKKVYMASMAFSGIVLVIFGFTGFPMFAFLLIEVAMYCFGNSTYWTIYYSMMYDISELDEFVNDKRREGAITAVMAFCQKLGAALAMWITGQLLAWGNYGVAGYEEGAKRIVLWINTTIPGIIGILAAVCVITYPLTKDKFKAISEALAAKKAGKEYSTKEFESIL